MKKNLVISLVIVALTIIFAIVWACCPFISTNQTIAADDAVYDASEDIIMGNNNQDFSKIGLKLVNETMEWMFGGKEVDDIIEKLGPPIQTIDKVEYERWYFNNGVEIDVVCQNDAFFMLFNYVYINNTSDLTTDRKVGIGSSKNQVIKSYATEINTAISDENYIFAGTEYRGLIFKIEDERVKAIYIGVGPRTMGDKGFPNR